MSDNGTLVFTLAPAAAEAEDEPTGRLYVVVNWFDELMSSLSPD